MISFLILISFRAIKRVTRLLEGKKRYWKQHWYVRALEKGNTTQNRAAMRFGTITKFINSHREPKEAPSLNKALPREKTVLCLSDRHDCHVHGTGPFQRFPTSQFCDDADRRT